MKLEEILKSPITCYEIAESGWKSFIHRKDLDKIIAAMAEDQHLCDSAALKWKDKRFKRAAQQIIASVTQDPFYSLEAGTHWNDERFYQACDKIAEAVSKGRYSYHAFSTWKIDRVKACEAKLAEWIYINNDYIDSIGTNLPDDRFDIIAGHIKGLEPDHARRAGIFWKDERFERLAEVIVQSVTSDSDSSYYAGRDWSDERFKKYADRLMQSVQKDAVYTYRAITSWPDDRILTLRKKLTPDFLKFEGFVRKIPHEQRDAALAFAVNIGHEAVSRLSITEFYNAAEALAFAEQTRQQDRFYQGLKESIEKGTVNKWAKTIIKYFRDASKGAGNYRMIEVTA